VRTCSGEDVHAIILLQAQLPEAGSDAQGQLLVLREAQILISAEFEICPFLVHLLFLTIDYLLDLLDLLVSLDELP